MSRDWDKRIVVVVGVGRSGTSLLQAMLHRHRHISFLPETHIFRRYIGPSLRRYWNQARGGQALAKRLKKDREFSRAQIDPEILLEGASRDGGRFQVHDVYLELLKEHAIRRDVRVVGDKDPRLMDFLPALARYVPGASILHIVRDPRDVLVSRRKAGWSGGRSDLSHLLVYRAQMRRGRTTGRRCFGERYRELRYEDLLRRPEETLTSVCRHIGVQYDPGMLDFGESARELIAEEEWGWKKNMVGPLMSGNIGNWEEELSPEVRRRVEGLCMDPFNDLDYLPGDEDQGSGRNVAGRLTAWMAQGLAALTTHLYPIRTCFG